MVYKYVDPKFPNPHGVSDTDFIIYGYTPSLALAVIGAVIFGLYGLIAIWLIMRPRRAGAILTLIGAIFELVGYICRCLSAKVRLHGSIKTLKLEIKRNRLHAVTFRAILSTQHFDSEGPSASYSL